MGKGRMIFHVRSRTLSISRLQSVILRSEATKNPISGKQATCCVKNETLRFAQGDISKCDSYLNAIFQGEAGCSLVVS